MLLLAALTVARADQCAWIERPVAVAAQRFLAPGTPWAALCEPCGEREPVGHVVGTTSIAPTPTPGLVELSIDGQPVDLAYVFVRATPADARLTNLAKLARCPASGVSATIGSPKPPPAPGGGLPDVPVPSPCAQLTDADGDGRWDFVQRYGYSADRVLDLVWTDADADGRADAVVRIEHDAAGRPTRATHDDDGDGRVDRTSDCRAQHCTTNWIPTCPARTDCTLGPEGLVAEMRSDRRVTVNDYRCWGKEDGLWRYVGPHPDVTAR